MTLDIHTQKGIDWLETLLRLANLSVSVQGVIPEGAWVEADNRWLTIPAHHLTPTQIQILIGHDGEVIDAIQYLASTLLNLGQPHGERVAYTIELDGYRLGRQHELRAIAEESAAKARSSGKEVEIRSLSSAERRQVHSFLQDCSDLETFSRGNEPDRRLIVKPL